MAACLTWWKDLAQLVQAGVVSSGILVGGIWTYLLFVHKRLAYPRANLELSISQLPIVRDKSRLVHIAAVSIKNTGDVLLKSAYAELRLRQVVLIPERLV